jgi:hypothetical protein
VTTLQESFVAHLNANAGVAALLAGRIHPNVIPEDWALPALAWQRVGSDEDLPHNAVRTWGQTRVQFTAQAKSYEDVTHVINAVKDALRGFRGQMGGGVHVHGVFIENDLDGFGDELDRATARVDALFIHREG